MVVTEQQKNNGICAVYFADTGILDDESLFKRAYEAASAERKQKTDRLRFQKDKCRCLLSELLLVYALKRGGEDFVAPKYSYGEFGKPYIKDSSLFFSISHSGDFVMCVTAPFEVGCDVEQVKEGKLSIAERFFKKSEYERILAGEDPKEQSILFTRFWTLKESFVKALGEGFHIPFDSFELMLEPYPALTGREDAGQYFIAEFSPAKDVRAALCCKGKPDCVTVKNAGKAELFP